MSEKISTLTRDQILRKVFKEQGSREIMQVAMDASSLPTELMMIIFENNLSGRQLALEYEQSGYLSEAIKEHVGVAEEFKAKLDKDTWDKVSAGGLANCPSIKSLSTTEREQIADTLFKAAIGYFHGMRAVLVDEDKVKTFAMLTKVLDPVGLFGVEERLFSSRESKSVSIKINRILRQYNIDVPNLHHYIVRNDHDRNPFNIGGEMRKEREQKIPDIDTDKLLSVRVQYNLAYYSCDLLPSPLFQDIFMRLVVDIIRQGSYDLGLDLLLQKLHSAESTIVVDGKKPIDFSSALPLIVEIFDEIKKQYAGPNDGRQKGGSTKEKIETLLLRFYKFLRSIIYPSSTISDGEKEQVEKICDWCLEFTTKQNCYESFALSFERKLQQGIGSLDTMSRDFINFVETTDDDKSKRKAMLKLYEEYRSPGIVDGKKVRMRDSKKALYWHSRYHSASTSTF